MPLTPEDTHMVEEAGTAERKSSARFAAALNSKYLKPAAALLVALGAGFAALRLVLRKKRPGK